MPAAVSRPPPKLRDPGDGRICLARRQADPVEAGSGLVKPWATENAEQLLGAVDSQ